MVTLKQIRKQIGSGKRRIKVAKVIARAEKKQVTATKKRQRTIGIKLKAQRKRTKARQIKARKFVAL